MTLPASARAAILVGIGVGAAACDAAERREAESVVEAVGRFRRANNADEPGAAAQLRATRCSAEDVCRTRDTCLIAADAIAKSLALRQEVEAALDALDGGKLALESPAAKSLPGKLDEAERIFKEGYAALPACDTNIAALKRRYRF